MRSLKVLIALIFTFLLVSIKTFAQSPLSDTAKISLLTCGPGDEMYSVFGHTAMRVYDPATGFDVVYNFGTFDFDTPNFYGKFVKGDLQYILSTSSYEDFVYTYVYYKRDVYEQVLNLDKSQKQNIANELNLTLFSESRFYTYKFIHRNCTTMVADILNKNLPGKISLDTSSKGKTYRESLYTALTGHFYENLGISLVFGFETDRESEKLFLPHELMEGVANTITSGGALATSTIAVNKVSGEKNASAWNNFYTFGFICLLLMVVSHNRKVMGVLLAVLGFLGIFFCFVSLYSSHPELKYNYNILLINPLYLVLIYLIIKDKTKTLITASYICLGLLTLYMALLIGKPHLISVLPLTALIAIMLLRIILSGKKALHK